MISQLLCYALGVHEAKVMHVLYRHCPFEASQWHHHIEPPRGAAREPRQRAGGRRPAERALVLSPRGELVAGFRLPARARACRLSPTGRSGWGGAGVGRGWCDLDAVKIELKCDMKNTINSLQLHVVLIHNGSTSCCSWSPTARWPGTVIVLQRGSQNRIS